jgi:UDP-GlcNAc:undecaprenyl-phosphate GlcNAc-1-phosphate transferase
VELIGIVLFILTAGTSLFVTPLVVKLATFLNFLDHPETRKIHANPTPKLGGVSIIGSVGITLLGAVILAHDLTPLPISMKFGFQSIAALLAIFWGIRFDHISFVGEAGLDLGVFAYLFTFLWIIGITNAFNLIDGLDGLAAGLASIAAGTCAVVFFMRGNYGEALLLLIVLGALVGFLRYNFYPAKIFLGDSGSYVIGYLLALTAITGSQKGVTALAIAFPLLVFGLPIADTLLSMVRRYLKDLQMMEPSKGRIKHKLRSLKRMFEPDREHIHHRLLAVGFSHRGAVLLLYGLGVGLSLLAFLTVLANGRNAGLILVLVALASYIGISKLGYRELRVIQAKPFLRIYEKIGLQKGFFLAFVDFLLITLSYWTAFLLKYEFTWNADVLFWYQTGFLFTLAIQFGTFFLFGLYKGIWPALSTGDLLRVVSAVGIGTMLSLILMTVNEIPPGIFGFFAVDGLILTGVTLISRSTYRIWDYLKTNRNQSGCEILIYGAGKGGQLVLREIIQNPKLGLRPLGFLDDDPALRGKTVNQLSILGSCEELDQILIKHPKAILVMASAGIESWRIKRVKSACQVHGVPLYRFDVHITPLDPFPSEFNHELLTPEPPRFQEKAQTPLEKQREREPVYD